MANQRTSRSLGLVRLLLLASTASALTLSNFQLISSAEVPGQCITAYNTDLPACQLNDAKNGPACSIRCQASLVAAEKNVQTACAGFEAASGSLLSEAQAGSLVRTLCQPAGTVETSRDDDDDERPGPGERGPGRDRQRETLTVTELPPTETIVLAPGSPSVPAPAPVISKGASFKVELPPPNSVTITTAIRPTIPAGADNGRATAAPTNGASEGAPSRDGGKFGVDNAAPSMRQSVSVICAVAAGAVLFLMH